MRHGLVLLLLFSGGCAVPTRSTRSGMKPTLERALAAVIEEDDPVVAEAALAADIELFEGVAKTYPEDGDFLLLAAEARATYALVFLALPEPHRAESMYRRARMLAELALRHNESYFALVGERRIEDVPYAELEQALAALEPKDALALFLVAFCWRGGETSSDRTKIAAMSQRVLTLDDTVFWGFGAPLLAGIVALIELRLPEADRQLKAVHERGFLIGDVIRAGLAADKDTALSAIIQATPRVDRILFENAAKRSACRQLSAHADDELRASCRQILAEAR
jgi:hypothetical protein